MNDEDRTFWSALGMGVFIGAILTLMLFVILGTYQRNSEYPIRCPVLEVMTVNDAVVVVRECRDGTIITDYPWMGE